ncbi:MAG: glycosyltransferase family 2 protein [Gammaproteobacteria bacterium]
MQETETTPGHNQHIAICVPTYRRSNMLTDCLAAIGRLTCPPGRRVTIIVADNDEDGSARNAVERIRSLLPFPLHYVIEQERGLAAVRNRLLEEAVKLGADWIAFIDDDEMPEREWLVVFVEAAGRFRADVVTGPLVQLENPDEVHIPRDRSRRPTGTTPRFVATNNVMFSSRLVKEQGLRFDRYYDFIGGEDFDFFNRSGANGNVHVWISEALVFETVPPERKTLSYLFYRHLTGGVNNVLRHKRNFAAWRSWCHFIPKIIGKLFGSLFSIARAGLTVNRGTARKALKQLGSALGYGAGLLNIVVERYRHIDGN